MNGASREIKPSVQVRKSHRKAAENFLDSVVGAFRRSALSKVLYPLTSPRSRAVADKIADILIRELVKLGKIQRHAHLHYVKISLDRRLRSGRIVPEYNEVVTLTLTTRCPEKWLSIDLETGEAWYGCASGWRQATSDERKEASTCLTS